MFCVWAGSEPRARERSMCVYLSALALFLSHTNVSLLGKLYVYGLGSFISFFFSRGGGEGGV